MSEELHIMVGRIEGKQDMTLDLVKDIHSRLDVHNDKINSLERSRSAAIASAGAVGGIFGFLGSTGLGRAIAAIMGAH